MKAEQFKALESELMSMPNEVHDVFMDARNNAGDVELDSDEFWAIYQGSIVDILSFGYISADTVKWFADRGIRA